MSHVQKKRIQELENKVKDLQSEISSLQKQLNVTTEAEFA